MNKSTDNLMILYHFLYSAAKSKKQINKYVHLRFNPYSSDELFNSIFSHLKLWIATSSDRKFMWFVKFKYQYISMFYGYFCKYGVLFSKTIFHLRIFPKSETVVHNSRFKWTNYDPTLNTFPWCLSIYVFVSPCQAQAASQDGGTLSEYIRGLFAHRPCRWLPGKLFYVLLYVLAE